MSCCVGAFHVIHVCELAHWTFRKSQVVLCLALVPLVMPGHVCSSYVTKMGNTECATVGFCLKTSTFGRITSLCVTEEDSKVMLADVEGVGGLII